MNNDNRITDTPSWHDIEREFVKNMMEQNDTLAKEVIEQEKRHAKFWFIAWVITLAVLAGTNAAWIYVFQSYEYISQDGTGMNNVNSGLQGDFINGSEGQD